MRLVDNRLEGFFVCLFPQVKFLRFFSGTHSGLDTPVAVLSSGIMVTMVTTSEQNMLRENACYLAALCGVKTSRLFLTAGAQNFLVRSLLCVRERRRRSHM